MATLSFSDLSFSWPDGTPVFAGLHGVLGPGHIGLVGDNGAGKTTLLRMLAAELTPARGAVTVTGRLGYLRQDLGLAADLRVDEVLGIAGVRRALHRIESGVGTEADFELVGTQWEVEESAIALLGMLGLGYVADSPDQLDRRLSALSGGETGLLGLVAELITEPDVLLLDEPTNNLDSVARERLYEVIDRFSGTVVTVSHDRQLLSRVDTIAELRQGKLRIFGGNFEAYQDIIAAEQAAAQAAIREARSDVRKQAQELHEARIKLDRRRRYGQKMRDTKREPKIVMGMRQRQAQVSAGKLRNAHIDRLDTAKEQLDQARDQLRDDREIRVDLPDTRLYPGQAVCALSDVALPSGAMVSLQVMGPEQIALTGRNGVGKTTLLRHLAASPPQVPWAILPQRLDIFDPRRSVFDNVAAGAPQVPPQQIRAQLARFLFRGSAADLPAAALSGGQRLRAALALVLLADPAPRLLMLDEPTNNADLNSLGHLTQALAGFAGALIVVSHDQRFLTEIGVTRSLELTDTGLLER